jgi:IS30 family transposase
MNYTHLTQDERYQIYALRLEKNSLSDIAKQLNRHITTITRELARNKGSGAWRPLQAQCNADKRQKNSRNARRIDEHDFAQVKEYLQIDLSPQQAIDRLSLQRKTKVCISHETVYLRIYAEKKKDPSLVNNLRAQKLYRKRRANGPERRGQLKNRTSIDERPEIVNQKCRIGDLEGDTVVGKNHQGVIVTLVDRMSRFTFAKHLPSRHAAGVTNAIQQLLEPHKDICHTLTFDNGKEFAGHEAIADFLQVKVFFAHPYCSYERGLNENTNGLLRQYFPKKTSFENITPEDLQRALNRLNHRPRKCLGFRTPYEVFYNLDILPLNPLNFQ